MSRSKIDLNWYCEKCGEKIDYRTLKSTISHKCKSQKQKNAKGSGEESVSGHSGLCQIKTSQDSSVEKGMEYLRTQIIDCEGKPVEKLYKDDSFYVPEIRQAIQIAVKSSLDKRNDEVKRIIKKCTKIGYILDERFEVVFLEELLKRLGFK